MTGDFGIFFLKGKVMGFEEAVDLLRRYHTRLWFNASLDVIQRSFCDRWRSGEILSGAGRLLAMQAGHPDEWQLNFKQTVPDSPLRAR